MDERIISNLFDAPFASTGLITKHSDLNRFYTYPDCFKRLVAEERAKGGIDELGNVMPDETWKFALPNSDYDSSWDARQTEISRHRSDRRLALERSLNIMVGTAEDREKYSSLVRDYIKYTNSDEASMSAGRSERQRRLREQEKETEGLLDDKIAKAYMSGENTEELEKMSRLVNLDQVDNLYKYHLKLSSFMLYFVGALQAC